jgi:hypothetical protein
MSDDERMIFKVDWCSPLNKQNCLTFYLKKIDMFDFLEHTLINSITTIQPIKCNVFSDEFIEAQKWNNIYKNDPQKSRTEPRG